MTIRWNLPRLIGVAGVVAVIGLNAEAGDVASDMKKAGKSIAKAATQFGHDVAEATEQGAKSAWYTTRNWTTRESRQVADATVRFWDDVIRGKESKRDRLRRENETLKAKSRDRNKVE